MFSVKNNIPHMIQTRIRLIEVDVIILPFQKKAKLLLSVIDS